MCHNLYFGKTLLRNAKLVRVCQNYRKFKHKRCSKLCRVSSPAMSSLKCYTCLRPTPKQAADPWEWREGTDDISDYDLALFPPQCHFPKNTSKEFIIVFQNERDENKRLQWSLDLTKGQGTKRISEPPKSTFRSLEVHSKRRCKISCSVILGELALSIFEITRASVLFSQKF